MLSTGNMGLTVWNLLSDTFDPIALQTDFATIDAHDHSFGKGVQISTAGIQPGSITQVLLASNMIGTAQLQNNSVGTVNLQNNSVTNAQIAPGSVTGASIVAGTVGATQLDPNVVPLGSIMQWWRPAGSSAVPGGFWEIMDGRPWNTITNAWHLTSGNIPDTRGKFSQGADLTGVNGPYIETYRGSSTVNLNHRHQVESHGHNVPAHHHAIDDDGEHHHKWQNGLSIWARANAFPLGLTIEDWHGSQATNRYYSLYISNLFSNPVWDASVLDGLADMDLDGIHDHGGQTGNDDLWSLLTGNSAPFASYEMGNVNLEPKNVSFLWIMRCR